MIDFYVPSKPKNYRQERVSENIRKCLSEIFIRGSLEEILVFDKKTKKEKKLKISIAPTITKVDISPDLKNAKIFITSIDNENDVLEYFHHKNYFFKKEVAKNLQLRCAPNLIFKIDTIFDSAQKIEDIFQKLKDEDKN